MENQKIEITIKKVKSVGGAAFPELEITAKGLKEEHIVGTLRVAYQIAAEKFLKNKEVDKGSVEYFLHNESQDALNRIGEQAQEKLKI